MPASKAQQKAVSKYMKENYDVYQIRMKKGRKELIKSHAEAQGQSVNGYINAAIDEKIAREAVEGHISTIEAEAVFFPTGNEKAVSGPSEGRT